MYWEKCNALTFQFWRCRSYSINWNTPMSKTKSVLNLNSSYVKKARPLHGFWILNFHQSCIHSTKNIHLIELFAGCLPFCFQNYWFVWVYAGLVNLKCIKPAYMLHAQNKGLHGLRNQKASESFIGEPTSGIINLLNPPFWSKTYQSMAASCPTFICFLFCIAILLLSNIFSNSLMQILDVASFISVCFKFT